MKYFYNITSGPVYIFFQAALLLQHLFYFKLQRNVRHVFMLFGEVSVQQPRFFFHMAKEVEVSTDEVEFSADDTPSRHTFLKQH